MALLGILLVGMTGALAELLLLGHDEDAIQLVPVVLTASGLVVVVVNALRAGPTSVRALQALMLLFAAAGLAGVYFHYRANVEFQLELEPQLSGPALLWKVLRAKAPPALSPGLMVQMALVGLAFTWRHPALHARDEGGSR